MVDNKQNIAKRLVQSKPQRNVCSWLKKCFRYVSVCNMHFRLFCGCGLLDSYLCQPLLDVGLKLMEYEKDRNRYPMAKHSQKFGNKRIGTCEY